MKPPLCCSAFDKNRIVPEERRRSRFIDFPGSNQRNELDDVLRFGFDTEAIEIEEQVGSSESRPFVPVHKGMIFDDSEKIGGGQLAKIRLSVSFFLQWSGKCRFEHALVTYAGSPAVKAKLLGM